MTLYASLDQKSPIMEVPQPLLLNGWKRRLESLEILLFSGPRLVNRGWSKKARTWVPSSCCVSALTGC